MSAATGDGIRSRVLNGLGWKLVSQTFLQGSRMVVAIVLARLLAPHDYGVAALVLIFSNLVLVFADLALGAALVQRPEISEEDRSTVFWTSVAAGALFTLVGVACSGVLARFFNHPEARPLFAVFSASFVVIALGSTQSALLTREMRFRSLELRNMAATATGSVVGISVALLHFGAWAIIAQQLAISTMSTVLLWRFSTWRPRFLFSLASLRELGTFSANVLGTRVLFFANRNADNFLIGKFVGAAALGAYSVSYNVMLVPFSQIAEPIQQVLLPAFSRMQTDVARMRDAWLRANRLIAAVSVPSLVGLTIVAPDFVDVVLGGRWRTAVPVIQVLAWVGLIQSLQRLNSSVLQARDRTAPLLRYSFVVLAGSLVAFVGGLHWGIVGVSVGYAISSTIIEPYYTFLTTRALETTLWGFLRSLAGVAQATAAMALCTLPLRLLLVHLGASPAARLAAVAAAGTAVFVPLCLWRVPEVAEEVRRVRRRRRAGAAALAAEPA